jgi:DNA-directed RNA polymerase subunit RPC12/RpoP
MTTKTKIVGYVYPWAAYNVDEQNRVFLTCPSCSLKITVKNKKSLEYFKHFLAVHPEQVEPSAKGGN